MKTLETYTVKDGTKVVVYENNSPIETVNFTKNEAHMVSSKIEELKDFYAIEA